MTEPTQEQARRLVRRTDRKVIGGVASGLADYFGVDPMLFRIGFVVFAIAGFGGILAYLLAWAFIPAYDRPASEQRAAVAKWGGIALIVIGALTVVPALLAFLTGGFFFDGFHGPWGRPGPGGPNVGPIEKLFVAGLLLAVGVLLLRRPAPRADISPADGNAATTMTPPGPPLAPSASATSLPRRPRSPLPAFTLAAVCVGVGLAAALSNVGILSLDIGQYAALAMLLLGAGILIGAWWGRARILIWLGMLMLPFVLGGSLIDVSLDGDIGSHYVQAHHPDDLLDRQILFGDLTLDLTQFPFAEHPDEEVNLRFGAGEVRVIVPPDLYVEASVDTRLGEAFVFDSYEDGFDLDIDVASGNPVSRARLRINVTGGMGAVSIRRGDFPPGMFPIPQPMPPPPLHGLAPLWGPFDDAGRNYR